MGAAAGRVCERYHRDGTACVNITTNADGWCRTGGCPGYTRPRTAIAPDDVPRAPRGTPAHVAATGDRRVDMDPDEAYEVRIARRAVDSFRFHHGGSAQAATAQLRAMLEDFLLSSARRTSASGFLTLARDGYELVLSPQLSAVTGYSTCHRERTWAQVRAGVKSRFGKNERGPRPQTHGPTPPDPDPALDVDAIPGAVDPGTAHLTGRVRTSFARLTGQRNLSEDDLDTALRAELATLRHGTAHRDRDLPGTEVLTATWRWLVSDDATSVIGVAKLRPRAGLEEQAPVTS